MPAQIKIKVKDRWVQLNPRYYFTVDVDNPANDRVMDMVKGLPIRAVYRRVSASSRGFHYIVVSRYYISNHHDTREKFGDDPRRLRFDRRRVDFWDEWEGDYYAGLLFDRKIKYRIEKGKLKLSDYTAGRWEKVI